MPALSFSAMEILPALLSHKKTQTMRPLFKKVKIPIGCEKGKPIKFRDGFVYRKPRLKVGDIVTLYWKQRSKGLRFCSKCGEATIYKGEREPGLKCLGAKEFPKLLGKVKITEVFEIEMVRTGKLEWEISGGDHYATYNANSNDGMDCEWISKLAKKDGFSHCYKMFKWFDKAYDLSTPKRFAVYRWK